MRDLAGEDQQEGGKVDLFVDEPALQQRIQNERRNNERGQGSIRNPVTKTPFKPIEEEQTGVHGELAGASQPRQDKEPLLKERNRP